MSLGQVEQIAGDYGVTKIAKLSTNFANYISSRVPLPATVSGVNQVTFTANATVNNPIYIYSPLKPIELRTTLAYTWTSGTNNILDANGAASTVTGSTLGIWYYYFGYDSTGAVVIRPSQTGPAGTQGPYNSGPYGHPGTTKSQYWTYVGFHLCTTAATPVFMAMTKTGFRYEFEAITVATSDTKGELAFENAKALPKLKLLGGTLGGYVTTGTVGTVAVASYDTATVGIVWVDATGLAGMELVVPFSGLPMSTNGKVWAVDTIARGSVSITSVMDVI